MRTGDPLEGSEDPLSSAPATPLGRGPRREATEESRLVEAFRRAAQGFSSDRVIADPVLNAAFIDQCGTLSLSGCPRDWNLTLMALRKQGKLADDRTTRRTQFSWAEMDPFAFASEMALRRLLDLGYPSLDHILCDPHAAARFDQLARSLVPGFSSVQYRWAALRLRKDARLWRQSSQQIAKTLRPTRRQVLLDENVVARLEQVPAVYVLSMALDDVPPVYVGETPDLSGRAQRTLSARTALDQFLVNPGVWRLDLFELADVNESDRRGFQSLLIGRDKPLMNYLELANEQV